MGLLSQKTKPQPTGTHYFVKQYKARKKKEIYVVFHLWKVTSYLTDDSEKLTITCLKKY